MMHDALITFQIDNSLSSYTYTLALTIKSSIEDVTMGYSWLLSLLISKQNVLNRKIMDPLEGSFVEEDKLPN